jgi:hypothetical protein
VKYLVALTFIGIVAAALLILWMSTYGASTRSPERDRARAQWKAVDRPPRNGREGEAWIALTGPSGFEFDHKKITTYPNGDGPRMILAQADAESAATFLNKRIVPASRHGRRKPSRKQGES